MGIKYTAADDVLHDFEEENGAGGTTRPVHGLASSIVSIFTSIKVAVEALAGLISASKLATSDATAATKLDTVIGHVDGLESSLSSILTAVATTLAGYLDGVEGYLDTVETKLQSILDAVGAASGGHKFGQVGSIGSSDMQFSSQALTRGMVVKNISGAGEVLYISHAGTVSSSTSYWLYPGETTPLIDCTNANAIYMRSSTGSAGKACYAGS